MSWKAAEQSLQEATICSLHWPHSFPQRFPGCPGVFQPKEDSQSHVEKRRPLIKQLDNSEWDMGRAKQASSLWGLWPLDAELVPGHLQENGLLEGLEIQRRIPLPPLTSNYLSFKELEADDLGCWATRHCVGFVLQEQLCSGKKTEVKTPG